MIYNKKESFWGRNW